MVENIKDDRAVAVAVVEVIEPTPLGAAYVKGTPAALRIGDVHRAEGGDFFNPRMSFTEAGMIELRESIKAQGMNQPILVRPRAAGGYEIVAGERRWRVMLDLHGIDGIIDVLIKDLDDDQAHAAAMTENMHRVSMNPVEEARAAHRLFERENGDIERAAERLGMKPPTFKRRMALTRATLAVQAALVAGDIVLGHAELLAAVDPSKQDGALEKVIKHKLTVEKLKDQVAAMSCDLPGAIFDKSGCAGCEFNSTQQAEMFSETVTEGRCTRPLCYHEKEEARLQEIKGSLVDEYAKVEILRGTDHIIPIKLVATGKMGVGEEQAKACRSCVSFGCSVSAIVGSMGRVEHGVCWDSPCNARNVVKNRKSIEAAEKIEQQAQAPAVTKGQDGRQRPKAQGKGAASEEAGKKKKGSTPAKSAAPVTVQLSMSVKSYRVDCWRRIAARKVYSSPDMALRVLVALALNGSTRHINSGRTRDALEKIGGATLGETIHNMRAATNAVRDTDPMKLQRVTHAMAASAMADMDETHMRQVLEFLDVDMASPETPWTLDESLLKLLSKVEVEAVADEVGISAVLGSAAMKKAMASKKDELIATVLGLKDFDYSRAVPSCMQYSAGSTPGASTDTAEWDDGAGGEEDEPALAAQG